MAVITKIGGVATSGTSGVGGLFGSGGGGSSSATATPTISLGTSSTYGGNSVTISNYGTISDYGTVRLSVTQSDGTDITPNADDYNIVITSGSAEVTWDDPSTYYGTYTVSVRVVDMEASPKEVESAAATATYTRSEPAFEYYKFQVTDVAGAAQALHIAIGDVQLWSGPNGTGTQYTGSGNTYGEYLTGYTTGDLADTILPSDGYNFSSYDGWKPFNNFTNISNSWWTLSVPFSTPEVNYLMVKIKTGGTSQFSTLPAIGSIRLFINTNGSAGFLKVMGSTTGAFAGEEHDYGIMSFTEGIYNVINA